MERQAEQFFDIVRSWQKTLHVILEGERFVGYCIDSLDELTLADAEAALTEALQSLAEQQGGLFAAAPVYKGVELLTETHIELLVVASVKEADVYTARRALQRAIRLSFEKAGIGAPTSV